ncbi:hypothetical protein [Chroococcus sp. FPU101]|uniref:hypothetical protein n=1 Tax=Chroococcus sp. FPU101 TaxID=1974212 RepID=UPI001A8F2D06|nr:hypothetical protein [Chroococcus sp. FPU101]GFE68882.1 hypothetical protein CFPU101_14920 [Chroococcus sp. FPU101]
MRLKSWESPRKQGRNDKGKGGSARQRQIRKQMKMLQQKLKQGVEPSQIKGKSKEREINFSLFLFKNFNLLDKTK